LGNCHNHFSGRFLCTLGDLATVELWRERRAPCRPRGSAARSQTAATVGPVRRLESYRSFRSTNDDTATIRRRGERQTSLRKAPRMPWLRSIGHIRALAGLAVAAALFAACANGGTADSGSGGNGSGGETGSGGAATGGSGDGSAGGVSGTGGVPGTGGVSGT